MILSHGITSSPDPWFSPISLPPFLSLFREPVSLWHMLYNNVQLRLKVRCSLSRSNLFFPTCYRQRKRWVHKYFLPFLDVPWSSRSSPLFALAVPNGQTLGTAIAWFSLSSAPWYWGHSEGWSGSEISEVWLSWLVQRYHHRDSRLIFGCGSRAVNDSPFSYGRKSRRPAASILGATCLWL